MKLVNPADEELNFFFATEVCKWKKTFKEPRPEWAACAIYGWVDERGADVPRQPWFTDSADAVLPWLEKTGMDAQITYSDTCCNWVVIMMQRFTGKKSFRGEGEQLPRAIVLALLRAHGVEVEVST